MFISKCFFFFSLSSLTYVVVVVQMLSCLKEFGKSDDLYSLLKEYTISPWESWTIEEKVVHAPGTQIGGGHIAVEHLLFQEVG